MRKYEKKERGITLIALVITIIVLLILVGIAIAALSGENGILTRASEAKQKTSREEIVEKAKLEILEYEAENERKITDEEAKAIIAKYDIEYQENTDFGFKTNQQGEKIIKVQGGQEIPINEIYMFPQLVKFYINGTSWEIQEGATWNDFAEQQEDTINDCALEWDVKDLIIQGNTYDYHREHLCAQFTSNIYMVCIHDENNIIPRRDSLIKNGAKYTSCVDDLR